MIFSLLREVDPTSGHSELHPYFDSILLTKIVR